jgi:hypothetical protein
MESPKVANVAYTDTYIDLRSKSIRPAGAGLFGSRFDEFWNAYPRSVGKKAARKAWDRSKLDGVADAIIADVKRRICGEWAGKDEQYIPHASTYLNGERWNDGIPKGAAALGTVEQPSWMDGVV